MKLLQLVFQAFGPFVKKQTIDFTILNDKGMFLINGPTGTGKTTIFDAVTYALFGKGSGKDRDDGKSLRSDFANDDEITYVNLVFEANGHTYRIYRQAPYKRKKQKGEGYTDEPGKVELYMPDNTVVSKVKDVDNKIVNEILFMTRDQFKNVALLAQGEFTQLITADSKSRAAILEHIFQKEIYEEFQDKVYEISNAAKGKVAAVKQSIETLINSIENVDSITGYTEAIADPSNVPGFLANVEDLINQLKQEFDNAHKEKESAHDEYQASATALSNLKNENSQIKNYLNALKKKEELDKQASSMAEMKKNLESQIEIDGIKPLFRQIATLNQSIGNNNTVIANKQTALKTIEADKKWLNENRNTYESNKTRIEELNRIIPNLNQFLEDKKKLIKDKSNLIAVQNKYKNVLNDNQIKEKEFLSIKHRFFASSASNLASELDENQPCPVCGSLHHPCLAHTDDAVSEAEYNKAEQEYNSSNQTLANNKTSFETAKATFVQKEASLITALSKNGYENANNELLYSDRVDNDVTNLETERTNKSKFNSAYELKDKQVPIQESAHKQAIESATEAIKEATTQIAEVNKNIDDKLNNNKHIKTRELYDSKTLENNNRHFNVEDSQRRLEQYNADLVSTKTIIGNTPKELIEKGFINEATLVEETSVKEAAYKELNNKANSLDNRINNLKNSVSKIKEKYDECSSVIQEYTSLNELANTAKGFNRMRLSFKMYVLADYFDKILIQANKRLTKITNGRYRLVRSDDLRKGNAQQGLDLDVYDVETGKERPASSLSGGEKFVSALSLALGLSDIIETNHALIQVESIFIDEGFGTLDDVYIDMAMKALESLKQDNKTVAIISHVEKLKSYIPDSLVVSKAEVGSTIKFESKI